MPKQTKYAADKEVMLKRVLGRIDKHTSKGVSAPPRAAKAKKKAATKPGLRASLPSQL